MRDALALRRDFISNFLPTDSPRRSCAAEVTTNETCLWDCYDDSTSCLNMHPTGPHTFGSWGASMPTSAYASVIPWVFANNKRYPSLAGMLLHPLTAARGEDTVESRARDHTWGIWSSTTLPLDYDFLQHNVYDCSVCDPVSCRQACPSPPPL